MWSGRWMCVTVMDMEGEGKAGGAAWIRCYEAAVGSHQRFVVEP